MCIEMGDNRFSRIDGRAATRVLGHGLAKTRDKMFEPHPLPTAVIACAMALAAPALAASVVGSRHDLSTRTTQHVCEFCHTPHQASLVALPVPLWSRMESTQNFSVYGNAAVDGGRVAPGVVTRLCLSCHDGVNAVAVAYGTALPCPSCASGHPEAARPRPLGGDFRVEHPVAVVNPSSAQSSDFRMPPDPENGWTRPGEDDVKLFGGAVECGSCHNAHNPRIVPFLRTSNADEGLCLRCHRK